MRGLLAVCCLLVMGCASFRDAIDQDFLYLKMCAEAERAWRIYCPIDLQYHPYPKDFEQGFMDGFVAVAFGANGCPPTLPSRDYWGPRFKNDVGKARIVAWYNGYAAGANAAQSEDLQDRNRLPTAVELFSHRPMKAAASGMTPVSPSSVAPTLETLPPIPEMPPPGTPPVTPPMTEPLPLPFPASAAVRPRTAPPPTSLGMWKPVGAPAAMMSPPVIMPASAAIPVSTPAPVSTASPGPTGAFGLSQPGNLGR